MRYALSILESTYRESDRRPEEALDEHREILTAFLERNATKAGRLVEEHALANEELLVGAVDSLDVTGLSAQ